MRNRHARRGFTLLEILVVLALFLILGAVVIPSISGMYGNTRQKVAADVLRARLADARALAMETGVPYRIAISGDNTKIRVAPDGLEFASTPAGSGGTAKAIESTLEKATAEREIDPDEPPSAADADGWQTIVTFLPDG
ncbi:MAG TPA: type II secretion system protein, partial [Gemmataceae bacterium]|nr:type II secretion system protein [Gemmataceae bacterium]